MWKLFRTILRERKKREVDPLLEALHSCRDAVRPKEGRKIGPEAGEAEEMVARIDQMLEFMHLIEAISRRFIGPDGEGLETAARLLDRAS